MRLSFARPAAAGLLAVGILALTGCGGGKGTLAGKVTVKGTPMTGGTVMIENPDGEIVVGNIVGGKYVVENVGPGKVKIAVIPGIDGDSPQANMTPQQQREKGNFGRERAAKQSAEVAKKAAETGTTVPGPYQRTESTPLTYDTAKGFAMDIEIP